MLFRKKAKEKTKEKPKVKRPLFRKIINSFLGIGIGLLIIFLIAFGYTQTSSFRNWLNEFVTEQVNSSTNGNLSIGEIDGTIFTSLILSDLSYTLEDDTLLSANKIELKFSPLRIFLKTIYLRKLDIENANISLLEDEKGVLNLSKITNPPEEEVMEEAVTTTDPFSWKIDISGLNLTNINFRHQSFTKKNSTAYYPQLFMDDLRLKNLNLSLTADINIAANEYQLYISKFNVEPNLEGFKLLDLSGNFIFLKDVAGIVDLNIITDRSTISLNAASSDFKPFEDDFDIAEAPLKVELNVDNLNFDDLTNFIDGTEILKGNVKTVLDAEGSLNDLRVKNLEVKLDSTYLNASGSLQDITDGDRMNISMNFRNSFINQDDVTTLLPELDIPTYKEYGVLNFDTLSYSGQPLDFTAKMNLKTDKGKISSIVKMNLREEEIVYDYQIKTEQLNLMPVAGINTNLNMYSSITGKGFSPVNLETDIQINAGASTIQGVAFNQFNIDAAGSQGKIKTDISFQALETNGRLDTQFDFSDTNSTKYSFDILLNSLNISDFFKESEINSDLNFSFKGDGENFGEDDLNLFALLEINQSRLNEIKLDSIVLIADVRSSEDDRVINIISDLADLTISGKYSIPEMVGLISQEIDMLSSSIQDKIEQIQPPKFENSEPVLATENLKDEDIFEYFSDKNLDVQYLLELKSFDLISLFLGNAEIEIDGEITGELFSSADTTFLNLNTNIDQMRYWDGFDLYFLYDFEFALSMTNGPSLNSFDDFFAEAKINAERIFVGSEFTNLNFGLKFEKNVAEVKLRTAFDGSTTVDFDGLFSVDDEIVDVVFNKLKIKYEDFYLQNKDDIEFSYSDDKFIFNSFVLYDDRGELNLKGQLSLTGQEDLTLTVADMNLKSISIGILKLPPEKVIQGEMNLNFSMTGTAEEPLMDLGFNLDSIKVQNYYLGSIESSAKYLNKVLSTKLMFSESKNNLERKSLRLEGTLPIDLSFNAKESVPLDKEVSLAFLADNFDLRFASSFIPGVTNLVGTLNGEVNLDGYYDDIKNVGNLKIENASFVSEFSNLKYLLDASLEFQNEKILLSSMSLRNDPSIKDGGVIFASGQIDHQLFDIGKINLNASGSLKILDQKTKAVSPELYGDITIETREDIVFLSSEDRSYLGLDLLLKSGANITYSPTQTAFTNENDKFTYLFTAAKTEDELEKEIDSLLVLAELKRQERNLAQKIPFNFDLKLEVEKEAKFVFVLSREFKQNLTAYLGGSLEYSVINEIPFAQGELKLLDGSKLDFIKTFQAAGNIRFIEELDNPYINVVATYESFYNPDTLRTSANEYDVQIRIKLEGTADDIVSNFRKMDENIEVYKSRRNANQFELDATKTSSDAIFFVIANVFPEDATLQESNLVATTLNALAGSVIGSILNEQFGDIIRTVNIRQRGDETVFSLVGKVEEFRYEIGGTSQVFQDLTRATVKIEHPLFVPNFVVRFYRTEPAYQSTTYSEMINELGLKYTFVF
jgi:hypothetical protein